MQRTLCSTIDEFARLAPSDQREASLTGLSTDSPEVGASGRLVRYLFSTPDVGRDLHVVDAAAWQVDNFLKNPVFLFCHDDSSLPIGRVTKLAFVGDELRGTVEYMTPDLNPFADTIYRCVRGGWLNATSTSWLPIEYRPANDKRRPGGLNFTSVDLLEISQVPVPAMPDALAEARAAGINLRPLALWAERSLENSSYRAVPRRQLERISRACGPARTVSLPGRSFPTRADRLRRAREIQANSASSASGAPPDSRADRLYRLGVLHRRRVLEGW